MMDNQRHQQRRTALLNDNNYYNKMACICNSKNCLEKRKLSKRIEEYNHEYYIDIEKVNLPKRRPNL